MQVAKKKDVIPGADGSQDGPLRRSERCAPKDVGAPSVSRRPRASSDTSNRMLPDCMRIGIIALMPRDIYEQIVELRNQGRKAALATIVARKGSTPRRDPAKMLIFEDGTLSGSI